MSPLAVPMLVLLHAPCAAGHLEALVVDGVPVDVYTPPGEVHADVLVLPGWDSDRAEWCRKGGLCDEADRRGLRLLMPEMGKSVYAWEVYPETTASLSKDPTRRQLEERIIPALQREHQLLATRSASVVIGRSTGGRGAILLALDHPEWFRAATSLSGDFDQTAMPRDGLMRGAYGPLERFPDRWRGVDNPQLRIAALTVPLYLGHAVRDPMVPVDQTRSFGEAVKRAHPTLPLVLHVVEGGSHTHAYWRTELGPAFDFMLGAATATPPTPPRTNP